MKKMMRVLVIAVAGLVLTGIHARGQYYPNGGYQGGAYGSGGDQALHVEVLDVQANLGGCYSGSGMNATLNAKDMLPLNQPYDADPSAYWYYDGNESVDEIPGDDMVDWIVAELRETAGGPSTATADSVIATRAGFLRADGSITDLDGASPLRFKYITAVDNAYVVVKHRNHLAVMNAVPLPLAGEVRSWNFRNDPLSAYHQPGYTNNEPQVLVNDGIYALWPGNAKPDHVVKYHGSHNDRESVLELVGTASLSAVMEGYFREDLDMDGEVRYMGGNNDKIKIYIILGNNTLDSLKTHVPE